MAKESMKARERKRERLVNRYEKKRAELTKILKSTDTSEEIQSQKWDAMMQIQKLPANSSKIRKHNRKDISFGIHFYISTSCSQVLIHIFTSEVKFIKG